MSFFSQTTKTVQIDDENSAVVRALTYAERQTCISMATKASIKGGVETIDIDPSRLRIEQLRRSVVSWAGPGFDGRPVSAENVDALPPFVADMLSEVADALNSEPQAAEKKALMSGTKG